MTFMGSLRSYNLKKCPVHTCNFVFLTFLLYSICRAINTYFISFTIGIIGILVYCVRMVFARFSIMFPTATAHCTLQTTHYTLHTTLLNPEYIL